MKQILTFIKKGISSARLQLDRFIFSSKNTKDSALFLAFFRCTIPVLAIIDILSISSDLSFFFSKDKTLIPQELGYLTSEYFPLLDQFYGFLRHYALLDFFYDNVVLFYIAALILLAVGLGTRFTAIIALLLQLIIFRSFPIFNYGYDHFMTMSLFYCVVFPVGRFFSLDYYLFKPQNSMNSLPYKRIIQIHLTLVYFFSGIAKCVDPNWWDGDAIWRATASFFNSSFYIPPIVLAISGIAVVLLELLHPFLIYYKKTRQITLIAVVLMHVSIGAFMHLYSFAAIMIIWNITSYYSFKPSEKKSLYEVKASA
ncbi:HTTM domain-containing protein [Aquimarina hainanensis]|uniref:HTTM domain-containing protein n=1 Tax=Aquimarina hainanensis TaxID=1578017 RepID=A0ABW5N5H0_9FLAO|nr:HTTM domain-containing protein [Aquimarina sp. TRL1]QKX04498.1 HTTM domain-containing protein [Aquimarina sp. TRL1]